MVTPHAIRPGENRKPVHGKPREASLSSCSPSTERLSVYFLTQPAWLRTADLLIQILGMKTSPRRRLPRQRGGGGAHLAAPPSSPGLPLRPRTPSARLQTLLFLFFNSGTTLSSAFWGPARILPPPPPTAVEARRLAPNPAPALSVPLLAEALSQGGGCGAAPLGRGSPGTSVPVEAGAGARVSPAHRDQVPPLHRGVAGRDALPAGGGAQPP